MQCIIIITYNLFDALVFVNEYGLSLFGILVHITNLIIKLEHINLNSFFVTNNNLSIVCCYIYKILS